LQKFSFLPSLSLIIKKNPFFVTSSQVPVEAYNLCTTGDDDKEKTKHTCGVSFCACVHAFASSCASARVCWCRAARKRSGVVLRAEAGRGWGGGLDLGGFLAGDNISGGTGGTIC